MSDMSLLLVGCGNMGRALLEGWTGWQDKKFDITILERDQAQASSLGTYDNVTVYSGFDSLEDDFSVDIVVLAVKPQHTEDVLEKCSNIFGQRVLYLSIVAGKKIEFFKSYLGPQVHIVRAMPNTPAIVGHGITALTSSETTNSREKDNASQLMRAVGEVIWLEEEKYMDVVTAISGSGPAYVFYFMECMIRIATDAGLDNEVAEALVMHTFHGSSELAFIDRSHNLSELRENVTSKGGTTEAALSHIMRSGGMFDLLQDAVEAAITRAKEL